MIKYQYIAERSAPYSIKISSPGDILPPLRRYRKLKQEAFVCISLDGAHQVTKVRVISLGLINRTVVHPREVYVGAIEDRAAAIILCHNHPSGNLEPSNEDHEITQRLKKAGEIIGIPVLDHVILGKGKEYYSFLESGTF
jgi:DNA repair protein RadC